MSADLRLYSLRGSSAMPEVAFVLLEDIVERGKKNAGSKPSTAPHASTKSREGRLFLPASQREMSAVEAETFCASSDWVRARNSRPILRHCPQKLVVICPIDSLCQSNLRPSQSNLHRIDELAITRITARG